MDVSRVTILALRASLAVALVAVTVLLLAGPSPSQAGLPVLTVNDTGDAPDANAGDGDCLTAGGFCTLRAAIEEANGAGDRNEIRFALPLARARITPAGTAYTIQPTTVLPAISNPAFIDGRTQKGYSGSPLIHLDGSLLTEGMGLYLQAGDSLIAGLRISGFPDNPATPQFTYGAQIFVASGSADSSFEDNVLGLNGAGLASGSQMGIWLNSTTHMAVRNNVLSGSIAYGLYVAGGMDIDVSGNLIGLNEQGTAAVPNGVYGIFLFGPSDVSIGMNGVARAGDTGLNVISGNGVDGVHINGAMNTAIAGNYIGTDFTGSQDVGNGDYGVFVRESPNTSIGLPGMGNVISGNGDGPFEAGVFVFDPAPVVDVGGEGTTLGGSLNILGNLIGTNAACDAAIPNENGIVVIDQPNDDRFFWDDALIDENIISGNEGTAPAAAAGTVTAAGSDMVAGDGIVWGALLPPGENGLTISNNVVGSDCEGEPLGNSGDGAIFALEPAVNSSAAPGVAPAGGGPGFIEFFVRVFLNNLSHNGEDCIQGDLFVGFDVGPVGASGDLGEILGLNAEFNDNEANSCGGDGVQINQRMSVLSYTEGSHVTLEEIRANSNGQNGVAVNQTLASGGGLPDTNLAAVQANDNAGNGILIDANADEAFTQPVQRKTTVSGSQASGNGGAGVRYEMLGGGLSQIDVDAPPLIIEDSSLNGNGAAGASVVGSFAPHAFVPSGVPEPPQPSVTIGHTMIADNGGAGIEVLQLEVPNATVHSSGSLIAAGEVEQTNTVIYNNGGPAIDLGGDGPTSNDAMDADAGPNGLTNFPVLTSAAAGNSITFTGTYDGAPNTDIDLRFYSNVACENGGEGEFYIGRQGIKTDAQGHSEFEIPFAEKNTPGRFVAATATGPEGVSEFSACIEGEGLGGISGDVDCDGDVDSVDALGVLREVAGLQPIPECIAFGNVDCDGDRDSIDALFILRFVAGLPVNLPKGCPEIGT